MRVAVQKLAGVESVTVSLERASTDIRLRPGNTLTLDQIRTLIRNNGFATKEATVTVVGRLIERGGQPALEVTGTNVVMLVEADTRQPDVFVQLQERLRTLPGAATRLTGAVESSGKLPDRLRVQSMAEE